MGVDKFEVTLNKPNRIYFSGDSVTVRVDITSISGFKLNEISGRIKGEAKTEWSKRSGNIRYVYKGTEGHLDRKFILFRKPHATPLELPPGQYTYQFTFQLPDDLPPSFDVSSFFLETIGSMQYYINVTMDRPWKFDETIHNPITINSLFDLNLYPSLREPAGTIMEKNFWCCINTGQIEGVVRIPYKGYVVGQHVPLTVQIENCSNLNINDILVEMKRRNKFYTVGRTRSLEKFETVKTQQSLGVSIKAGDTYAFCFNYKVPNVPVINMMNCSIIDVEYVLKFELLLSGLSCNMKGQLPILVGHVPLDNAQLPDEPAPFDLLNVRE